MQSSYVPYPEPTRAQLCLNTMEKNLFRNMVSFLDPITIASLTNTHRNINHMISEIKGVNVVDDFKKCAEQFAYAAFMEQRLDRIASQMQNESYRKDLTYISIITFTTIAGGIFSLFIDNGPQSYILKGLSYGAVSGVITGAIRSLRLGNPCEDPCGCCCGSAVCCAFGHLTGTLGTIVAPASFITTAALTAVGIFRKPSFNIERELEEMKDEENEKKSMLRKRKP